MNSRIITQDLNIGYEDSLIVKQLNLEIPNQKITSLVGANGSGKSTILKTIGRIMKSSGGTVYLDGKEIHLQKTKDIARKMTILPQNPFPPRGLKVDELVAYGRAPYQKGFNTLTKQDKEIVYWALEVSGMLPFANRDLDALSGGQMQRVWIAMALAQQTDILLLDEPTTFLDMAHQMDVLCLLERLNKEQQRTIVMVVHDLNHASRFSDYMIAIKSGEIVKKGTPSEVMTRDILKQVFDIDADIIAAPRMGYPLCVPFGTSCS
ncbi:ABC transporter ATP-binding protein [Paenibacillus thiaminolyticus]|uniref:ABC transporter ATP-binding protein n=1 Tax=Paenibacillus thiaminolyticus TaxID=49283 RepID=UPI003D2BF69B